VLAAAGVFGLAIGFGAQNLAQDFISGFFILLEDQVRVGDVVQIGDKGDWWKESPCAWSSSVTLPAAFTSSATARLTS